MPHLNQEERYQIYAFKESGLSLRAIAMQPITDILREVDEDTGCMDNFTHIHPDEAKMVIFENHNGVYIEVHE